MAKRDYKLIATDEKGRKRPYDSVKQAQDRIGFRIDHLIGKDKKDRHGRTWDKVGEVTK